MTVKQGGSTLGTCSTDSSGNCCYDVSGTGSGTYVVEASETSRTGSAKTVSVTCDGTTNVTLYTASTSQDLTLSANGCNSGAPIEGAEITINGGTYTTGASGGVNIALPSGTYSYTITVPGGRWATYNGTVTSYVCSSGGSFGASMSPATGYRCFCGCTFPVSETLYLTDPVVGTITMTYDSGAFKWKGTKTGFSFGGYCFCPAAGSITVNYELQIPFGSCQLSAIYNVNAITGCPENQVPAVSINLGFMTSPSSCPDTFSVSCTLGACACPGGTTCRLWGAGPTTFTLTE